MLAELKELWRFRELLWAMVERELRIRYKNSFLGFFWSLVNPVLTMLVMSLVFKVFLKNETENYTAYVFAAYLPFMFINLAIMDSAQSIIASLPVVKKVYFPREILPLASVIANFIHFLLALGVFFVYLFIVWASTGFGSSPFTFKIAFLPILLVVTLAFTIGSSLIISALNVFYEDVKYVVGVLLYLAFFLTPIMYFSENVWESLKGKGLVSLYYLYHLNPLAELATTFKKTLVPSGIVDAGQGVKIQPIGQSWPMFGVTALLSFGLLVLGYAVFNRMKWRFVERP